MLKVFETFAGIGGFSVGLERTKKFKTVAFCEIDKFCQKVLNKNWPDVPIYDDIRKVARWTWKGSKAQTSLRAAFRVRTYHTLEKVPDLPESVQVFGGSYAEPFAWYDHGSRCWRTWQRCLIEGWEQYSAPWPRSGMTRNGIAYQLPTLVRDNYGTEFGLWPAPNATAFKGGRLSPRRGVKNPERNNWQDWCSLALGQRYPNPETAEQVMGYPIGHTEINPSAMPLSPKSLKSSDTQ